MLTIENTGLIVVDIQGKLARSVHQSATFIMNCEKLIKGALLLKLPIIVVEQNPDKLGATVQELKDLLHNINPIIKFTFDACRSDEFLNKVKSTNVNNWLMCGIESHICVYQTAMGLLEKGYSIELVNDCVSSRTLSNKELAINRLRSEGVKITSLEMCLFELVKDCKAPEFKSMLSLIK